VFAAVSCSAAATDHSHHQGGHHQGGSTHAAPPGCDDGDACTADACIEGTGCTNPPLAGLAAATCVCEQGLPDACTDQRLAKPLTRAVGRACQLLAKAAAPTTKAKKVKKLLRGAARQWKAALRTVGSKKVNKTLDATCGDALAARYRDAKTRADTAALTP
jgi:hypothetical protein